MILKNGGLRRYMTDVITLIDELVNHDSKKIGKIAEIIVDTDWFGTSPIIHNNRVWLENKDIKFFLDMLNEFLENCDKPVSEKADILLSRLHMKLPLTTQFLKRFYDETYIPVSMQYEINDFTLYYLEKDLNLYDDNEIIALLEIICLTKTKQVGTVFVFFLSWLKEECRVSYKKDFILKNRVEFKTRAYAGEEYLELIYYLFSEGYIEKNQMYERAVKSKNYADTWLFLSLHFVCALRNSDLVRIPHPTLPFQAKVCLQKIKDNKYTDNDARLTLLSINLHMTTMPLAPQKTERYSNVNFIKLIIPESAEVHFGKLFTICESHYQLSNIAEQNLIRPIADYERINRYMGEDIGNLFLEANFSSRAANKAYLQSIEMFADDILNVHEISNTKGYMIAALARSHKGSYGSFAATTSTYLRDAAFNGYSPEYIARELFERGVLSFIPSMLLNMITNSEYKKLPLKKQTEMIKLLDMTPNEIENIVSIANEGRRKAKNTVHEVIENTGDGQQEVIKRILKNISSGSAVSKNSECLCLCTAMEKICPFENRKNCIGCKYELHTKSTFYLILSEYKRLRSLYRTNQQIETKIKVEKILRQVLLPALDEILQCINDQYGIESRKEYEELIRRMMNE